MTKPNPGFSASQIASMQWNRTINVEALKQNEAEMIAAGKEIPRDVLERVAEAIRSQLKQEKAGQRAELISINIPIK